MSYLLLPADRRLKALAAQIEEERRHALDLPPRELGDPEELDEPPVERAPKGEGFEALSSSGAQLDEAILSETTLQLFGDRPRAERRPGRLHRRRAARRHAHGLPAGCGLGVRLPRAPARRARAARLRGRPPHRRGASRGARARQPAHGRAVGRRRHADQLEKGNALLERELAK